MAPLWLNILFKVNQLSGLNRLEMADTRVFHDIFNKSVWEFIQEEQPTCLFVFLSTHGEKKREFFFFNFRSRDKQKKKSHFSLRASIQTARGAYLKTKKNKKNLPFLSAFSNAMNLALICDNKIEKYFKKAKPQKTENETKIVKKTRDVSP